jgi:methionyl-tRNA formyltransferase
MVGFELDSGDIIEREYLPIGINTKVTECIDWIFRRVPRMFLSAIDKLEMNSNYVLANASTDPSEGIRCYPRQPIDGAINWLDGSEDIVRLINASNKPYSGAYFYFNGNKCIVWDATCYSDTENYLAVPGQVSKILIDEEAAVVICGEGKLQLNLIEVNGVVQHANQILTSIRSRLCNG